MLSFMFYMLLVLFVVCIVFAVLNSMLQGVSSIFQDIGDMAKTLNGMGSKGTGKQTYRVSIQYEKETESAEGQEVLHRVSSKHTRRLEEYLPILLDFAHGGAHFYLLKTRQEVLCLRQYEVLAFSNGQASRYTLKEVNASLQRKLCEPCGTLDEFCRQNYDKGAAEMNLNGTDTQQVRLCSCMLDLAQAGGAARGNGTSANGNKTGAGKSGSDSHNDPNKWGSDAWWEEQERFINDSLYVNHDWDIFKVEEARCDAEHCHDPYHHHEK